MPLRPGSSKQVISQNIKEMVASGHSPKVAVAAALHNADRHAKAAKTPSNHSSQHAMRGTPSKK